MKWFRKIVVEEGRVFWEDRRFWVGVIIGSFFAILLVQVLR
jgi:hypothetical protein